MKAIPKPTGPDIDECDVEIGDFSLNCCFEVWSDEAPDGTPESGANLIAVEISGAWFYSCDVLEDGLCSLLEEQYMADCREEWY